MTHSGLHWWHLDWCRSPGGGSGGCLARQVNTRLWNIVCVYNLCSWHVDYYHQNKKSKELYLYREVLSISYQLSMIRKIIENDNDKKLSSVTPINYWVITNNALISNNGNCIHCYGHFLFQVKLWVWKDLFHYLNSATGYYGESWDPRFQNREVRQRSESGEEKWWMILWWFMKYWRCGCIVCQS